MQHFGDITKIGGAIVPPVNVIIGGSPCQDLSIAGRRAGLAGERSGLFMEQIRIIKEMREADAISGRKGRDIRPRYMVWENVVGAFSSNGGGGLQSRPRRNDPHCRAGRARPSTTSTRKVAFGRCLLRRWVVCCLPRFRCAVLGSPPASP